MSLMCLDFSIADPDVVIEQAAYQLLGALWGEALVTGEGEYTKLGGDLL